MDFRGQTGPGDTSRMITYQVTFRYSGHYNLFARVNLGSGGYSDDSFFVGKGFGVKNETPGSDWVLINGLEQNYPNPFSYNSMITFSVATSANVSLKIYNSLEMIVASLINEYLNVETYTFNWDAKSVVNEGI